MTPTLEKLIKKHAEDLEKINNQRRLWLYASSVVVTGAIFVIFSWDWLDHFHSNELWWAIASMMIVISINWWYWTMRVIRVLLTHQQIEYDLIQCILKDISDAKKDIKLLVNQNIDTNT